MNNKHFFADCLIAIIRPFYWLWYRVIYRLFLIVRKWHYRNKPIGFLIKKDYEMFKKLYQ